MFYEEKCERGKWFWRGTPDGEWQEFSRDNMYAKLTEVTELFSQAKRDAQMECENVNRQAERHQRVYAELNRQLDEAKRDAERLNALINTPEIEDFLQGVRLEAAHQIERWGSAHDREKSAENWYWLVGYLGGKALRSTITGDRDKALHHCISSAAALMNWHSAIRDDESGAGIGKDGDIAPDGSKIEPDATLAKREGEGEK